jgi:hypothetical protein
MANTKIPVELSSTPGIVDGSNATAITIDSSENVGIGTTSPAAKLQIQTQTDGNAAFQNSTSVTGGVKINCFNNAANASSPFELDGSTLQFNIAATEKMRIDSSGAVLMGTTTQLHSSQLTVDNPSGQCGITLSETGTSVTALWGLDSLNAIGTRSNHAFNIRSNDTNRMTFDNSGLIGIGSTSPSTALDIAASTNSTNSAVYPVVTVQNTAANSDNSYAALNVKGGNGQVNGFILADGRSSANVFSIRTETATPIQFNTNGSEKMRILSNGQVCFNSTEIATASPTCGFNPNSNTGAELFYTRPSSFTGTGNSILNYHNGSYIGGINTSTSATIFLTSSDYRLKENIKPLENGLDRVSNLKPVQFDWKVDGKSSEGFIAHEAQEIFPDAVSGEKDDEKMQAMDYGRITPLLVKAIQEQQELIETQQTIINDLKSRIETLEG